MPYRVRLTKRARRRLDELPEDIRAALIESIVGPIAGNPRRLGHRCRRRLRGNTRPVVASTGSCTESMTMSASSSS